MYRLLFVDDKKIVNNEIINKLIKKGFAVSWIGWVCDGLQAIDNCVHNHPDIIITEIKIPYSDGISLVKKENAPMGQKKFIDRLYNTQDRYLFKRDILIDKKQIDLPVHKLKLLNNYIDNHDFNNILITLNDIFLPKDIVNRSDKYNSVLYFEILYLILNKIDDQDTITQLHNEFINGDILRINIDANKAIDHIYAVIENIIGETIFDCRDIVTKIINYIKINFTQDILVKDLAAKYNISPNYLSAVFKQETGQTLSKYIENIKIEKALQLLRDTKTNIADIARSIGYIDTHYFYRVFKKVMHMTPIEYRKQKVLSKT